MAMAVLAHSVMVLCLAAHFAVGLVVATRRPVPAAYAAAAGRAPSSTSSSSSGKARGDRDVDSGIAGRAGGSCGSNGTENTFWNASRCRSGRCCDTYWGAARPADCCEQCLATGIGNAPCAAWEWTASASVCYACTTKVLPFREPMRGHHTGCASPAVCPRASFGSRHAGRCRRPQSSAACGGCPR